MKDNCKHRNKFIVTILLEINGSIIKYLHIIIEFILFFNICMYQ